LVTFQDPQGSCAVFGLHFKPLVLIFCSPFVCWMIKDVCIDVLNGGVAALCGSVCEKGLDLPEGALFMHLEPLAWEHFGELAAKVHS